MSHVDRWAGTCIGTRSRWAAASAASSALSDDRKTRSSWSCPFLDALSLVACGRSFEVHGPANKLTCLSLTGKVPRQTSLLRVSSGLGWPLVLEKGRLSQPEKVSVKHNLYFPNTSMLDGYLGIRDFPKHIRALQTNHKPTQQKTDFAVTISGR